MPNDHDEPASAGTLNPSPEHYRQIIEAAGYVFFTVDIHCIFTHVDGGVVEMTGYNAEDLIGQPFSTLVRRDWKNRLINYYEQPPDKGTLIFPITKKNGEERWVEQKVVATQDTKGITGFQAIVTDITEQHHIEKILRANEARINAFFENATEALVVVDREGQIVTFNRSAENTFGYSREEITGKPLSTLIPTRYHRAHIGHIQHYLSDPRPRAMGQSLELAARRKDGSEFPVEISLSYNESTQETVAFVIDITLRIDYERQLAKRVRQLTTLREIDAELAERLDVDYVLKMALDSALQLSGGNAGFIGLTDDDGVRLAHTQGDYRGYTTGQTIQEVGGAVERIAHNQKAELILDVKTDPDFISNCPGTVAQMAIPLILHGNMIGVLNLETSEKDTFNEDTFSLVKMIATRIATAVDNARLYRQTETQLAELQDLYQKVSQLEQLKTDMIRIAAHDLRNPLAAIMGNAELVRMEIAAKNNPNTIQEYANNIGESVERMRKITSDILSLERIEEVAQNAVLTSFDLAELVRDTYEESKVSWLVASRQMTLSLPDDDAIKIQGDSAQIREAIANLIGNAIKYTEENGRIEVHLKQKNSEVIFEVTDNGFGIRKEQQDKLFQPFYRARTAQTVDIEGTGLGLHLVKNIIERHNGNIHFKSTFGKGSTFGFTLPLSTE
jgi:PAS domain S-box-containing protein